VLSRLQTEQATEADSNCVPHDNAGYCAGDENNVTFRSSEDGKDKGRTTSTTATVPAHSSDGVVSATMYTNSDRESSGHGVLTSGVDEGAHHGMRSLILILALSLHHLFEGISLGLQRTVTGALMLLIALLCHETIISFSLGLQFVKCSYTMRQHYTTAFLCSIVEPIGVAVGKSHSA